MIREGIDRVMQRYRGDQVPGLWAFFHVPVAELTRAYGRPGSRRVYDRGDLVRRWLRLWGEERHGQQGRAASGSRIG